MQVMTHVNFYLKENKIHFNFFEKLDEDKSQNPLNFPLHKKLKATKNAKCIHTPPSPQPFIRRQKDPMNGIYLL